MPIDSCATKAPASGKSLRIALREELSMTGAPNGDLWLTSPMGKITFRQVSPILRQAFDALTRGTTTQEITELVSKQGDPESLTRLYLHLEQLGKRGLITHTAVDSGKPLATITGIGQRYSFKLHDIDVSQPYQLSRFALWRRQGNKQVLESPLGQARIMVHDHRFSALTGALCNPRSLKDIEDQVPGLSDQAASDCFQLLLNADALSECLDGSSAEDNNETLAQWSFHDLLFHSRSRFGRHNDLYGATFRHIGKIDPRPAVKHPVAGTRIDLYSPDLATLRAGDPPLAQVMETRRSVYDYGTHPISLTELGEFLFRVARVRETGQMQVRSFYTEAQGTMEVSSRPYPAGGKCYDLEFYVTVDRCDGLPSGLYHYEPAEHCLMQVSGRTENVEALLKYASVAAPGGHPQVLITLASRFQRVSWKYDAIAYATTLKHVGVVYQTMYLAATAMGLGPCALGSGDSDLFAAAAGTDYLVESSVGEFMLGSLPGRND